jgi:hypothetical protein
MGRLEHTLLYLITALILFFNIERLDYNHESVINIQSFVYLVAVVAVISTIALPIFSRFSLSSTLAMWLAVYALLKVASTRPVLSGVYLYITATEVASLTILATLAYRVAGALQEFKEAVETIALGDLKDAVLPLEKANDLIRKEMRRSRHYHRALSVIVAVPNFKALKDKEPLPRPIQEVQEALAYRFSVAKLAKMIREEIRVVDTILEDKKNNRFIVVCPEVDHQNSAVLMEHIRSIVKRNFGVDVQCGAASFPDTALTFEELVVQASRSATVTYSSPTVASFTPQNVALSQS